MKYLLIILGIIILIPAIVWLIGMTLPQSHTAEVSRQIAAPPEEIFFLITNIENFPDWRSHVDRVEMVGKNSGNLEWREYYTNEDPISFRIVDLAENRFLVTEIADKNLPFGGSWTYKVEPEGEYTLLTITEHGEVYNPIFRFVSTFVMGHDGTIHQYMADLEKTLSS